MNDIKFNNELYTTFNSKVTNVLYDDIFSNLSKDYKNALWDEIVQDLTNKCHVLEVNEMIWETLRKF
jgi:hypothetical protein